MHHAYHVNDRLFDQGLLIWNDLVYCLPWRVDGLCKEVQDRWTAEVLIDSSTSSIADSEHSKLRWIADGTGRTTLEWCHRYQVGFSKS